MRAGNSVNSQQLTRPPSQRVSTCQLVLVLLTETTVTLSLSSHSRKTLFLTFQHVINFFFPISNSMLSKILWKNYPKLQFLHHLYLILAQCIGWTVACVCIKCDWQLCSDCLVPLFAQVTEHIANRSFAWLRRQMLSVTEKVFIDSQMDLLTHMTKPTCTAKGTKAAIKCPGSTEGTESSAP